jgi:hypothetical protein
MQLQHATITAVMSIRLSVRLSVPIVQRDISYWRNVFNLSILLKCGSNQTKRADTLQDDVQLHLSIT